MIYFSSPPAHPWGYAPATGAALLGRHAHTQASSAQEAWGTAPRSAALEHEFVPEMALLKVAHSVAWLKHTVPPPRLYWDVMRLMSPMHRTVLPLSGVVTAHCVEVGRVQVRGTRWLVNTGLQGVALCGTPHLGVVLCLRPRDTVKRHA